VNWRGAARRLLPYLVTAVAGFALAYLVVALFIFPKQLIPDDAKVPSVLGMNYDEAAKRLTGAGFRVETREQRYHESAPQNTILAQMPPAGAREPRGATIALDISRGPRFGQVPDIVGLPIAQVDRLLKGEGISRGIVTDSASDEPRGQVLASDPAPGTRVALPAAVALTISAGPGSVQVPDVIGQSVTEARLLLQQLGFRIRTQNDSASSMPSGVVVQQAPTPGASTRSGAVVTIVISAGSVP
jgi:serine/threonine-protein kinase